MKKSILTAIIFLSVFINAQVIISTDSTYTSTSSKVALDVNGKNGGVLFPTVELNTLFPKVDKPKEGTVVFNSLENIKDSTDSRPTGYYIFIDNKWRTLLDIDNGLKYIPRRITYTKSTFDKISGKSGSLILNPESYNNVNPSVPLSEDKSFELNVHFSNPYEKWKSIVDFNTKFRITSNYHKKNKLVLAIDGPISFTNYNSAIATFSVGAFLHKLQDNNVIETKLVGARMYDMDLQNVCTSNKRTLSFILEDLEEGEYIIEPVYRLIYSHDYRGGYSQTSTEDRWAYNYAGARNDDIRRTRMFIGTPEETMHYYTLYGVGNPQNFDGSIRSRPPGECDIDPFTYQSTIELIVYKKE